MSQMKSMDGAFPSQIVQMRPEVLSCLLDEGGGAVDFWISNPDSRVRCKVTLMYVPVEGEAIPQDITIVPHTLYLGINEIDRGGSRGCKIPVGDLVGTLAAPITIPQNANLMGYSREFVTAADEIWGRLVTEYVATVPGRWMLQVQYQPDGQRLPCEDWDWVKTQFNVRGSPPLISVGSGE